MENAESILEYLQQDEKHKKKYRYIKNVILLGFSNTNIYRKVINLNKLYEMRFFPNGDNDRIYCKQYEINNVIHIVMIELFLGKKTKKIDKRIKNRLDIIKNYNYELK
ncbi:MAG: hypothetical protein U9Q98_08425 [Bacteroidota bacterium]|nr:hypothetical protein [Bacteroidota bacterium]